MKKAWAWTTFVLLMVMAGALESGCDVNIREGQFLCDPMEPDPCPPGWVCLKRGTLTEYRCYSNGTVYCGNGRLDEGEQCDPGDPEHGIPPVIPDVPPPDRASFPMCTPYCSITMSRCGNGLVESNHLDGTALRQEECDDGNDVAGDGCSPDCMVEPGYCDASELEEFGQDRCTGFCGDGIKNGPEVCDGSDLGGLSCQYFGYHDGHLRCRDDCSGFDPSGCTGWCGDGERNGAEECDGPDDRGCTTVYGAVAGPLHCTSQCTLSGARCRYGWKDVSPLTAMGDPADLVEVIHAPDGWYAITSDNRIVRYDGAWSVWSLQQDMSLTSIVSWNSSIITAGYDTNNTTILYSFDGSSWTPFPAPEGADTPLSLVTDSGGDLYLLTEDTVYHWTGTDWEVYLTQADVGSGLFTAFGAYDPMGLVVGASDGLYYRQGGTWQHEGGSVPVMDMDIKGDWMHVSQGWWISVYKGGNTYSTYVLPHAGGIGSVCGWEDGQAVGYSDTENAFVYKVDDSWLLGSVPGFGEGVSLACHDGRAMAVGENAYAHMFLGSLSIPFDDPWPVHYRASAMTHTPDGYTYVLLTDDYYGAGSMLLICRDAACENIRIWDLCRSLDALDGQNFVVGCENGKVKVRDGDSTRDISVSTSGEITAVWLDEDGSILAGDDVGRMYRYDGSGWASVTPEGSQHRIEDISGRDGLVLAVSADTVYRWDGTAWHKDDEIPGVRLYTVAVVSAHRAYAGGTGGSMYVYDGTHWSSVHTPIHATILDIKRMDDSRIMVAGEDDTAMVYDGIVWAPVALPTHDDIKASAMVTQRRWWLVHPDGSRIDVVFGPDSWGDAPPPIYCGTVVTADLTDADGADGWCSAQGLEAGERIYSLDTPVSGQVQISLDSPSDSVRLFVLDENGACLGEGTGGSAQVLEIPTQRGTRLKVVVDGSDPTSFTLDVRCWPESQLF